MLKIDKFSTDKFLAFSDELTVFCKTQENFSIDEHANLQNDLSKYVKESKNTDLHDILLDVQEIFKDINIESCELFLHKEKETKRVNAINGKLCYVDYEVDIVGNVVKIIYYDNKVQSFECKKKNFSLENYNDINSLNNLSISLFKEIERVRLFIESKALQEEKVKIKEM